MRKEIIETLNLSKPEQLKVIVEDNKLYIAIEIKDLRIYENPDHRTSDIDSTERTVETLKRFWIIDSYKNQIPLYALWDYENGDQFLESKGLTYSHGFYDWYSELQNHFDDLIEQAKKFRKSLKQKTGTSTKEAEDFYNKQNFKGD